MSACWFSSLQIAHQLPGRVRWRFARASTARGDAEAMARAAGHLDGVTQVRVNARARSLVIHYDTHLTDPTRLQDALLQLHLASPQPRRGEIRQPLSRRGVETALATLVGTQLLPPSLQMVAAAIASQPLFRHALADALAEGLTSHVLEAAAVGISLARRDYLAANTTTFMLELGEYLEESIARRSDDMLKHLLVPVGPEVWIEREGSEIQIPTAELSVGDIVVIGTGSIVPVDGTVLSGDASVNEASMTGESAPVVKKRGDAVLSGTLLEEGRIRVYAEQVGARTAAARIADYVEQSLNVKSTAQLEASRMADRLVPIVLGLAAASWLASGDWRRVASVLQADYSCALKLATPVAFKSSMYGAGQQGILVKGATALERLAEADTFVFDKTGTLTSGSLEVTDSIAFDKAFSADELIWLAASVEEHYFHPLAQAVVSAARSSKGQHFDHTDVEFVVAHGVASVIKGKRIVVGSRHFIEDDEKIPVKQHEARLAPLYREGKTLLYVGLGGRLIGVLALRDTLRPESAATIARLRQLGAKRILMLTGDHRDRAAELAAALGLDDFHAELLPDGKASLIAQLAAEGARIAFIGDGINDAPALAGAHVGIAMQKGADIARMSADIALLEDDIGRVADAKALANSTMQRIDSNYRLAVGLNTTILGAASLGLLSPILTSTLHNGSTIAILLRACSRLPR